MTNSEILQAKTNYVVAPLVEEMKQHMCIECAIDTALETAILQIKSIPIEARQKLFASILINFNLETGEEINGPLQT